MTVQEQLYTIWLPLGITVVLGLIGLIRGAVREAIVAASVVLGAFIASQWGVKWGADLHDVFTRLDQQQTQFGLSFAVLWLVVLVTGYGLGSFVTGHALSVPSRLVGGLLGLASGAALAGWSLRYSITNTDGLLNPGPVLDDPLAHGFMIWAGWFPLMLAFLAALFVLVRPLRRAQVSVSRPSTESDWAPTTSTSAGSGGPPPVPAPYPASAVTQTNLPTYTPAGAMPAAERDSAQTVSLPVQDAAPMPTAPLPVREAHGAQANDWLSSAGSASAARIASSPAGTTAANGEPGTYNSGLSASSEPSWLLHSTRDTGASVSSPGSSEYGTPGASASGEPESTGRSAASDQPGEPDRKCPNCGSPVAPGAFFCTECGTRVG